MKGYLLAEKPSLCRTIKSVYEKHKDELPYEIDFMEQRGHLYTLAKPDDLDDSLKSWEFDTLPIYPENYGGWRYYPIKEHKTGNFLTAEERIKKIKNDLSAGNYDFIINAGDADQEGELLVRIVISEVGCKLPVKRFWNNDTTEQGILSSLQNLKDDDNDPMLVNLLKAAYVRQHSDWLYGMNISRAMTIKMGANPAIACGRVRTPILGIICKRELEIANFVPKTTYGVVANYTDGFSGQMYEKPDSSDSESEDKDDNVETGLVYYDEKSDAESCVGYLSSPGSVISYNTKRVETLPPKLFTLASAQIEGGKLGYSADEVLALIQSLYEKTYISYPRTDCEYITSGENLKAMLKSANSVPVLRQYISELPDESIGKVRGCKKWVNDKKAQEAGHTALVPTSNTPKFDDLSHDEQVIYEMIAKRFVSIFMPPRVQDKVVMLVQIGDKVFKTNGSTLVDMGWSDIYNSNIKDINIPAYNEGDIINVDNFEITEKTSVCPKRYSDAELIEACEHPAKFLDNVELKKLGDKLKIGKPATRASIIEELVTKNKYIERRKDGKVNRFAPTEVGMVIYDNIKDFGICKVDMTGEWEIFLEDIRFGNKERDSVEESVRGSVKQMIEEIKAASMDRLISNYVCDCPKCGGKIKAYPKGFSCSNRTSEGCQVGSYIKICDSEIRPDEFAKLMTGEEIVKDIKKGGNKWSQKLKYNFDTFKIEFVRSEDYKPVEKTETEYNCPKCGKALTDDGKKIACGCGFVFWKTRFDKEPFTKEQIDNFFNTGSTGLIDGIKKKDGTGTYSAMFNLKEDKTGCEMKFPPRN